MLFDDVLNLLMTTIAAFSDKPSEYVTMFVIRPSETAPTYILHVISQSINQPSVSILPHTLCNVL